MALPLRLEPPGTSAADPAALCGRPQAALQPTPATSVLAAGMALLVRSSSNSAPLSCRVAVSFTIVGVAARKGRTAAIATIWLSHGRNPASGLAQSQIARITCTQTTCRRPPGKRLEGTCEAQRGIVKAQHAAVKGAFSLTHSARSRSLANLFPRRMDAQMSLCLVQRHRWLG